MKVVKQIILTDEDIRLLSKPLPLNPCLVRCRGDRSACCGCPEQSKYAKVIKPYEEAGVLEYAVTMEQITALKSIIKQTEKSIDDLYAKLPDEVKKLIDTTN